MFRFACVLALVAFVVAEVEIIVHDCGDFLCHNRIFHFGSSRQYVCPVMQDTYVSASFGFATSTVTSFQENATCDVTICSKDSVINSILVDQCTQEPCTVHKGQDYTVHVNFTMTRTVTEAHNVLHGGLGFLQVPFPLHPESACGVNVPCPLESGKNYLYTNTMTCPDFAPSLRVSAKWEIKDENHKDIFCFATALQIRA